MVNAGNFIQTGTFWNVQSCTGAESDTTQRSVPLAGNVHEFLARLVGPLIGGAPLPFYADGPHCNVRGPTDLGRYLISAMIDRGFLIEVDHMNEVTADQVMTIIEQRRYRGVVSSYSWGYSRTIQRVYVVGGFATPHARGPGSTIGAWRQARAMYRPNLDFGFGFGSDINGPAPQGGPLGAGVVVYPFTSHDGRVTFDRERWGLRTSDINTDGTATTAATPTGSKRSASRSARRC